MSQFEIRRPGDGCPNGTFYVDSPNPGNAHMEQYFLDRRAYSDGDGTCGVALPPPAPSADAFDVTCSASASTYVVTATGRAGGGMAGFAFTVDETGARATLALPAGWTRTVECWTYRPDGSCL